MNILCFDPFPLLTTDRLLLRRLVTKDAHEIFKLRSDVRVNKFLDRPIADSTEEVLQFIQKINEVVNNNESIYWGIALKNKLTLLIGTICLWNFSNENSIAEIGFELNPDFQGKGIMQEAINTVISFGFSQLKLETITAYVHVQNEHSIRALERCNFKPDPNFEYKDSIQDGLKNTIIYTINNDENF